MDLRAHDVARLHVCVFEENRAVDLGRIRFRAADGAILVGDIRFAMLPTSSRPLWSVRCGPGGTAAETALKMDRYLGDGDWGRLGGLLTGADPRYFPIP